MKNKTDKIVAIFILNLSRILTMSISIGSTLAMWIICAFAIKDILLGIALSEFLRGVITVAFLYSIGKLFIRLDDKLEKYENENDLKLK